MVTNFCWKQDTFARPKEMQPLGQQSSERDDKISCYLEFPLFFNIISIILNIY